MQTGQNYLVGRNNSSTCKDSTYTRIAKDKEFIVHFLSLHLKRKITASEQICNDILMHSAVA
jgi:hypothetical protein